MVIEIIVILRPVYCLPRPQGWLLFWGNLQPLQFGLGLRFAGGQLVLLPEVLIYGISIIITRELRKFDGGVDCYKNCLVNILEILGSLC